jgi:hypothetical protein
LGPWAMAIHWRAVKNSLRGTVCYYCNLVRYASIFDFPNIKMLASLSKYISIFRMCTLRFASSTVCY